MILDKAIHPREKPCAGAVSGWGLDALAKIDVPLDVPHVTMRGLRVLDGDARGASAWGAREPGQAGRKTDAAEAGLGVVVRRSELDASLWRRAAGDGVRAYDDEGLVELARVPGGWEIVTTKRTFRAHLVAACDASAWTVRSAPHLPEAARKGHLYVLETPFREGADADAGPRAGLCAFGCWTHAWGGPSAYWIHRDRRRLRTCRRGLPTRISPLRRLVKPPRRGAGSTRRRSSSPRAPAPSPRTGIRARSSCARR